MASMCENKPKINYPCFWKYKLIISKDEKIENIVALVTKQKEYKLEFSNLSSNGNYQSHNLSVFILNDKERLDIFNKLKSKCKFVL
ncbi:DUF493 domain-containing protein [Campylobacter sp. RM12327]|nr:MULTISPECIES: DUF493 domain-containing protein [unclassified Campylobacter]MBE7358238.1 DUF493 domain-containing protein [Campylobacter sp. RM11302]MBF6669530.1 DUF493 domain-containing protein [Campylobacter sp. RM12327]MBF6674239.1 DUF493 domain-containing protein [Campylobacter sp. RM13538]MBF6676023.1 DUF493 domain-containing protein [Campylobacter sp. RM12321]MBF6678028.1 DUF493 domain-containing protein [Campylobacter sp. RM11259]